MHKGLVFLIVPFLLIHAHSTLKADPASDNQREYAIKPFDHAHAFTGKITRDHVRMRVHPTVESPVVRELGRGTLLSVVGESDDFYAVKPPSDLKAYVYRPLVLDGVVEGKNVNVRLAPHLEAPIIGQLNTGDRINGAVSEKNSKWLEIAPPPSTMFFVSSEFIEKAGDANFLAKNEARKDKVDRELKTAEELAQSELKKPFQAIDSNRVATLFQQIIEEYPDFPNQVKQAEHSLAHFKETYLNRKLEYLEAMTRGKTDRIPVEDKHSALGMYERWITRKSASDANPKMASWIPIEVAYYEEWARSNPNRSLDYFYEEQKGQAVVLHGILESYDRPIRNKPGDYLLVNKVNGHPLAYVYSTHIDLQEMTGKEVVLKGFIRPNNHFAFPAYFVIEIE